MNRLPHWSSRSVCLAGFFGLSSCLAAGAQPPSAHRVDASAPAFKKSIESRLDEERARIRRIAEPVLERFRKARTPELEGNIVTQTIKIQSAEAAYQNAKLTHEISEIAVKEYEEGIYLQDVATAEGEIRIAEADIKRTDEDLAKSLANLERIKKAASGSVFDTVTVVNFEDRVKLAKASREKAGYALELAKSKLEVLRKYEKPKRLKELRSAVEMAFAHELALKQTHQLETDKLAFMKKQAEGPHAPAKYAPVLSLLADAVRLDHEIRAGLGELEPNVGEPQAGLRKQIEELARSLEAKVNEAGRLFEDLKFSELASEINFAATRRTAATGPPSSARISGFLEKFGKIAPEDRTKLKTGPVEERTRILKKAGFTDEEV